MQKPTLHLPGLFHTINNQEYSHCAFTGKVLRFPKMMQMQGYRVYDYSNEGSESRASRYFQILSKEEMGRLGAFQEGTAFHGNKATCGSPLHAAFEKGLIKNMIDHVVPGDIVCHPFGIAHERLLAVFPEAFHVETGIGYDRCVKDTYRIFESEAWRHTHIEREKRAATNYEWVIPNYYDLDDWTPSEAPGTYVAFMGRICEAKGMNTVLEMAKRGVRIKVAGQGDPGAWSHRNIDYVGPLKGKERDDFLRGASCLLMPTAFVEPFGGSAVEAMLCFPAATMVRTKGIDSTFDRVYSGVLCEINTVKGSITCTPEHPLLTQRGWIKAACIRDTDFLLRHIYDDEKVLEQRRIGDLVAELSASGSSENCGIVGDNGKPCFQQDEKDEVEAPESEMVYTAGDRTNSLALSERGDFSAMRHVKPPGASDHQKGSVTRCALYGVEHLDGGGTGDSEKAVRSARCDETFGDFRKDSRINLREGRKTRISEDLGGTGQTIQTRYDGSGISLSGGNDRRRRNYHAEKGYGSKIPAAHAADIKLLEGVGRLDITAVQPSGNSCFLPAGTRGEGLQGKETTAKRIHSIHSGPWTLAAIREYFTLLSCEEDASGSVSGVDARAAESMRKTFPAEIMSAAFAGAHDGFFEFDAVKNIRKHEAQGVHVYNVGTRSGTYEAEGFVVHNCGTPVLSVDWGAFTETVVPGVTGYRCKLLIDWLLGVDSCAALSRKVVYEHARARYGLQTVGTLYDRAFTQLRTLGEKGWYAGCPEPS